MHVFLQHKAHLLDFVSVSETWQQRMDGSDGSSGYGKQKTSAESVLTYDFC